MRLLLTLAVFALDLWALVSILGARASARSKVAWMLAVLALPLVGFIYWWLAGPKASLAR
jgi:hypothetical protein